MGKINVYKDLIVWQKAHSLVKYVLKLVKIFLVDDASKIIKKQWIRFVVSIPANIVEGFGGHHGSSFKNYLIIARRSAHETDYWLLLSFEENLIKKEDYEVVYKINQEVIALLTSIIQKRS